MPMQQYNSMPWQSGVSSGAIIFVLIFIVVIIMIVILGAIWNSRIITPPDDGNTGGSGNNGGSGNGGTVDDTHLSSKIDTDISDGSVF